MQLLLQGVPLYSEAYEMRMPGIFAAYALILCLYIPTGAFGLTYEVTRADRSLQLRALAALLQPDGSLGRVWTTPFTPAVV